MEVEKKNAVSVYSLYRKSTLGICLQDALDDLQERNHIGADLAQKVLEQFDKVLPLLPHLHRRRLRAFFSNRCSGGEEFFLFARGTVADVCPTCSR